MRKLLKIYLKFHIYFINKTFNELILKLDKEAFCFFYNLKYRFNNFDNFFSYDKKIIYLKPEILKGSKKILRKIEYISADEGFERGLKEESTLPKVCNLLINNSFELI